MNTPFLTIFTPTYNRAFILRQLYKSLIHQTVKDFEWVIVDDGSIDDTETLVSSFIQENKIPIVYHKKDNEGKHIAINKGVKLAKGELFFIVDSDDYLTKDAVEKIQEYYPKTADKNIAGLSFRRGVSETELIGSNNFKEITTSVLNFRYSMKIKGDMAEVYKTAVLKKFPFPTISDEKFCPESLVWNRIGKQYNMLWTSHIIYICEYLEGGLTSKITRLRKESSGYAMLYYSEFIQLNIPFSEKIKGAINYWRFALPNRTSFIEKWRRIPGYLSFIGLPAGILFNILKS